MIDYDLYKVGDLLGDIYDFTYIVTSKWKKMKIGSNEYMIIKVRPTDETMSKLPYSLIRYHYFNGWFVSEKKIYDGVVFKKEEPIDLIGMFENCEPLKL